MLRGLGGRTSYSTSHSSTSPIHGYSFGSCPHYSAVVSVNPISHGLDIRIDKKWFYKKLALNLYLDIQNVYNTKIKTQPYLDVIRDEFNNPIQNPVNSQYYLIDEIENSSGTILPSIGVMLEF